VSIFIIVIMALQMAFNPVHILVNRPAKASSASREEAMAICHIRDRKLNIHNHDKKTLVVYAIRCTRVRALGGYSLKAVFDRYMGTTSILLV
jgi:hypothetical protein